MLHCNGFTFFLHRSTLSTGKTRWRVKKAAVFFMTFSFTVRGLIPNVGIGIVQSALRKCLLMLRSAPLRYKWLCNKTFTEQRDIDCSTYTSLRTIYASSKLNQSKCECSWETNVISNACQSVKSLAAQPAVPFCYLKPKSKLCLLLLVNLTKRFIFCWPSGVSKLLRNWAHQGEYNLLLS